MLDKLHYNLVKTKKFPIFIRFPIVFFSNWLFQGMLYMDNTEKLFKISLDIIFFIIIISFISFFTYISLLNIFLIIIFVHTLNFFINGQIFVLLKNFDLVKTDNKKFLTYIENMKTRINKQDSIYYAAAYGSLSMGELTQFSDFDVRIVRKHGIKNGIIACIFVLIERIRALVSFFPLDIFLLDSKIKLFCLSSDGRPLIIKNNMIQNK